MKKLIILALASFSLSATSHAYNIQWQSSLAAPEKLLEEANQLKASVSDAKSMTQLLLQQDYDIKSDYVSLTTTIIDYYPRFLDIEDYGSKSIYFDQHEQNVEILSAITVTPQGKMVSVDPEQAKIIDTNEENVFTDDMQLLIPLPSLTEGSISIITYKIKTLRNQNEPHWASQNYTQRSYPIQQYILNAKWQQTEDIQWQARSKEVTCKESAQGISCFGDNIAAYKHDNSTRWQDHIGRIEMSDFSNWQQVVTQASKAMAKAELDTRGLDEIYQHLTDKVIHIEDKISNILNFVARDIRYVSISEAEHARTPHTIYQTLSNRYGDCKDKSTLLKALLDKAGIQSELVLVDTDRFNHTSMLLPAMNHFNHVVVCFDRHSDRYCLDPTDNLTHWQTTPTWIQGKANLILTANTHTPSQIPTNPYRWRFNHAMTINFDKLGGQTESQSRTYWGEYASYYRHALVNRNDKEQSEYLQNEYANEVSDLTTADFKIHNLDHVGSPLLIESNAHYDSFLDPKAEKIQYTENDAWLMHEFDSMRLRNKWHQEYFSGINVSSSYTFDLTDSPWQLAYLPSEIEFSHPYGTLVRKFDKRSNGRLQVITKVKIPAQTVSGDELSTFNQFLKLLHNHSTIQFTAIKK